MLEPCLCMVSVRKVGDESLFLSLSLFQSVTFIIFVQEVLGGKSFEKVSWPLFYLGVFHFILILIFFFLTSTKLGNVSINLAEYAGAGLGLVERRYLPQAVNDKQRQDNSLLLVSVEKKI